MCTKSSEKLLGYLLVTFYGVYGAFIDELKIINSFQLAADRQHV
jgi:hypothetical protein